MDLSSVTTLDISSEDEYTVQKPKKAKSKSKTATKSTKDKVEKKVDEICMSQTITTELEVPQLVGEFKSEKLVDCIDPVDYMYKVLDNEVMESIRLETCTHLNGIKGLNKVTIKDIHKMIGMLFVLDLYPFVDIEHAFGKRHSMYSSTFINNNYNLEDFREMHNELKLPNKDPMLLFNMI